MKDYFFSDKISSLQPSAIREILKFTADPNVISFAAGNPSAEAFPVDEIRKITGDILIEEPIAALQYSITEGYPALRDEVKKMVSRRVDSYCPERDEVLITSGAQQGIELFAKCSVNEQDVVLTENPSFIGSLNTIRSFNAKIDGVRVESDGLNIQELEQKLKSHQNVRFLYVIPNFQNPTGTTMSLDKRKAVLELAQKYDILILEDNPYGDLRFEGEDLPTIKSMDQEGRVVYVGSFSKILSPGLRLGYVVAPKPIISKMTVAKQGADVHTSILPQMIAQRFLANYDLDKHLAGLKKIYYHKAHLMMDQMEEQFSSKITYIKPQGGLFIWCTLPDQVDMVQFCTEAVHHKVACVPGTAFLPVENETSHSFRLNYSTPSDDKIVDGIRILGQLSKELLK